MLPFVPPDAITATDPTAEYEARQEHFAALRDDFERRSDQQGTVNVVLFFGALIALLAAFFAKISGLYWLAGALFVGFVASFAYHARLDEQRRRYRELTQMQAEGLARLARDWEHIPLRPYPPSDDTSHLARDLDLTGRASLLHLLSTANTPAGLATLQSWITAPSPIATAQARQGAAREPPGATDFRDALTLAARLMGNAQHDYEAFARWAEGPSPFAGHQWMLWAAR